jgi:hypothetical protein
MTIISDFFKQRQRAFNCASWLHQQGYQVNLTSGFWFVYKDFINTPAYCVGNMDLIRYARSLGWKP